MSQLSKYHNQVLLSLATEIRQARNWLMTSGKTSSFNTEWKARLSTLKEAAEAAGMRSIRSALENLQSKNTARDQSDIERNQSYTGQVLNQLADTLSALATPIEDHVAVWLDSVDNASDMLDCTTDLSHQNATRLAKCMRTLQNACISPTRAEQIEHLIKLGNSLKEIVSHHDQQHENIQTTKNQLQDASRKLMKNLPEAVNQTLFPQLVNMCKQINDSEEGSEDSITLKLGKNDITLTKGQIETIKRIVVFYIHHLLKAKVEYSANKHKSDKTCAKPICITASSYGPMVSIYIEDHVTSTNKTIILPSSIKQDLWKLRARLLVQQLPPQNNKLSLQIPALTGPIEAILVECETGPVLIPFAVIKEVLSTNRSHDPKLPIIRLGSGKKVKNKPSRYAVVIQVGEWRALFHAYTLQSPRRINPVAINLDDPAWVLARGEISSENWPIFHPLPFITIEKDQKRLYP